LHPLRSLGNRHGNIWRYQAQPALKRSQISFTHSQAEFGVTSANQLGEGGEYLTVQLGGPLRCHHLIVIRYKALGWDEAISGGEDEYIQMLTVIWPLPQKATKHPESRTVISLSGREQTWSRLLSLRAGHD